MWTPNRINNADLTISEKSVNLSWHFAQQMCHTSVVTKWKMKAKDTIKKKDLHSEATKEWESGQKPYPHFNVDLVNRTLTYLRQCIKHFKVSREAIAIVYSLKHGHLKADPNQDEIRRNLWPYFQNGPIGIYLSSTTYGTMRGMLYNMKKLRLQVEIFSSLLRPHYYY